MVCKNCKATIPEESSFCRYCGQKVETEPVAAPVASPAPEPVFSSAFRRAGSLDGDDFGMGEPVEEKIPAAPQAESGLRFSSNFKRDGGVPAADPVAEPVVKPVVVAPVKPAAEPMTPKWDDVAYIDPKETPAGNKCPHCGGPVKPDAKFCVNCGKKIGESLADKAAKKPAPVTKPEKAAPVKKPVPVKKPEKTKPSNSKPVAAAAIAIVLVLALIVGIATNWFGATGPAAQIARAANNTFASKNFTVDFEFTYDSMDVEASGTACVAIDPEERELTLYADMVADGEAGVIAVYDGYLMVGTDYGCYGYDISDQLDDYFDTYEEGTAKEISWEELLDSMIYEGAYEEAEEFVDFEKLESCLKSLVKKLNSKKWLKENAGYSVEKTDGITMHGFAPDIYTFVTASVAELEEAFIEAEEYEDLVDTLGDAKSAFKDIDIEFVLGVKGGKLVHLEGDVSGVGEDFQVEADFSNFGKTEFDIDELEDMLDEAKRNGF